MEISAAIISYSEHEENHLKKDFTAMLEFIKKVFKSSRGNQLVFTQPKQSETSKEKVRTIDPSSAPVIILPKGYRPQQEHQSQWPDGFWDHFDKASIHYKRGSYTKAKEEFLLARSLKNDYSSLNTQLLRTYRKLYKKATKKKRWREAYNILLEFFKTLPIEVTDTDRIQHNKIIKELEKKEPDFTGHAIELESYSRPLFEIEQNSKIDLKIQEHSDFWVRPKGEKPIRWHDTYLTSAGFVCRRPLNRKEQEGNKACQFRLITNQVDQASDIEFPIDLYRCKISFSGDHFIGYSDDLQLFYYKLNGEKVAERSVRREAENNKYYIRCVDLSDDGKWTLLTSSTKAYLMDDKLRFLHIWITPPPEEYQVERRAYESHSIEVEKALSVLELYGSPTPDEIKTQFRRLALQYHPDRNPEDPHAERKMKTIIEAYQVLSDEDIQSALDGIGDVETYYKVMNEREVNLKDLGISFKITLSISGHGDWIYASYISTDAERIYLGCYSGRIYCVNKKGRVLKTFVADETIRMIEERESYLFIETNNSLYVIKNDEVINQIEIVKGYFSTFTTWGFIIKRGYIISFYTYSGNLIGNISFSKEPYEILETQTGTIIYTKKERVRFTVS